MATKRFRLLGLVTVAVSLLTRTLSIEFGFVANVNDDCSYDVFEEKSGQVVLKGVVPAFAFEGNWTRLRCFGKPRVVLGRMKEFGNDRYWGWQMTMRDVVSGQDIVSISIRNTERAILFGFRLLKTIHPNLNDQNQLVSTFPAFESSSLNGALSWQGSFVQPQRVGQGCTSGTQGGPCILYNTTNVSHGRAVMLSPLNHFLTSGQSTVRWDKKNLVWSASTVGSIKLLPEGFSHLFILVGGQDGVTDTIHKWGSLMQEYYGTTRANDITISTLGYQTDNGAQYCFGCRGDCPQVLLNELEYLRENGVPVRYLSYQNAWWHTSGSAPWCVSDWDWVPQKVPMGVPEFNRLAGIPFQLYAPYFCNETKYAQNFTFLTSNPSLPTCSGFLFKDIAPNDSKRFYRWFFELGISYGMVSYEADFINQNLNCVDEFLEVLGAAETFLDGMAETARDLDISVQWCYASPSALLQSLKYPAVTNFRGSFDYFYGGSWDIGLSSLLMWALNIAPSTDTFWTSDNGDQATKLGACDAKNGCPEDHMDTGCELHTLLALFSTGPVGFSDAINHTNTARIRRTCREDGILLRPSKPLTAMDTFLREKFVMQTYSGRTVRRVFGYYVVAHHMNSDKIVSVPLNDFWPRLSTQIGNNAGWFLRQQGHDASCYKNGAPASECVSAVASTVTIPRTKTTFEPVLLVLTPICTSGWSFLGEIEKFAALSTNRILSLTCQSPSKARPNGGIKVEVTGSPGESVFLSFVGPDTENHSGSRVWTRNVTIPVSLNHKSWESVMVGSHSLESLVTVVVSLPN